MISTTTIKSLPTLFCSPTNGIRRIPPPPLNIDLSLLFLTGKLLHRATLNDKRDYSEPHEFKPEHFLKDGELDSSVRDTMDIAFGFGRR